ncbi:BspA family leucine-rich repeat surface protein [Butyrivibrio sp. WCE2006]|uniref:BspA family leucine-rich repeat surface protein n=1 Tax=Butyrivibrio sp. WCE2006 TaxID=1410611 RepID=UPI0005D1DE44|nr:BspA family leucine-rich repeat surface protein [Butyrivibrio sp. WCE2006]
MRKISRLYISKNNSNVENMYRMFSYSLALNSINISSFNTSKVTNVQEMFDSCTSLEHLDLRIFDLTNVPAEKAGSFLENARI